MPNVAFFLVLFYKFMKYFFYFQEWSGLGPLMLTSRLSKLQDIQKLTEAEQFLQLANKPCEFSQDCS